MDERLQVSVPDLTGDSDMTLTDWAVSEGLVKSPYLYQSVERNPERKRPNPFEFKGWPDSNIMTANFFRSYIDAIEQADIKARKDQYRQTKTEALKERLRSMYGQI